MLQYAYKAMLRNYLKVYTVLLVRFWKHYNCKNMDVLYMKRFITVLLTLAMLFSVVVVVSAEEIENDDSSVVARASSTNASYTVTDAKGNRFHVWGMCYDANGKAATYTTFDTAHYIDGTATGKKVLDSMAKTIVSGGTVVMINGIHGASTEYSPRRNLYGASNEFTGMSDSLLYMITNITGSHSFSCNGGSNTGISSYSAF